MVSKVKINKDIWKEVMQDFWRDASGLILKFRERVGDEICERFLNEWPINVLVSYEGMFRQMEKEEREWKEALMKMDLSKMLWL